MSEPRDAMRETPALPSLGGSAPTLDAGRELDALIAEKVMGWTVNRRDGGAWHLVNVKNYGIATRCCDSGLPEFSTDIAAAWKVVEHVESRGLDVRLYVCRDGYAASVIDSEDLPDITLGRASVDPREGGMPLAICRAVLASLLYEENDLATLAARRSTPSASPEVPR